MIPFEVSSRREWLETNGIGGFASSTVAGLNTRRYHGLLVAATKPPVGRMVLLSKLEETLVIGDHRIDLSCNRYPGVIHPGGHEHLREIRFEPFPTFVYEVDGIRLTKSIFMAHGENTTVVEYRLEGGPCKLEVRPLLAFRDYHATAHENGALDPALRIEPGRVACAPYQGCPTLWLAHTDGDVSRTGDWYRNFEYTVEQERGLEFHEDLFNPLVLTFELSRDGRAAIVASTEARDAASAESLRAREFARRTSLSEDPFKQALIRAADQFVVRRGSGKTVIAGYHWFSDWGRDTMIALPGLTLSTGRYEDARGILQAFAASVDRGMLPNRFPDAGETPEYNTVDATLWFFEAVRAYLAHTSDLAFVRAELLGVLADIVAWHERGTRYGIRADADGLLLAGEPGVQLTWMDAKIGDWVVTPRHGKPVEIQALWHNALRIMHDLTGDAHYRDLADRAQESFVRQFWNEADGCLYDVVNGDARDASIRPNQIFAISLFHSLLPPGMAARVLEAVERHLLTPYGLRSLASSDPQYRGRFEGGPESRDSAYHQGTVWPWLMGPYVTAYRNVHGRPPDWTGPFRRFVEESGSQIPEVFDGDAPHRPGGCLAQAWSVAELLRCLTEETAASTRVRAASAPHTEAAA
jgi:predicted glycogen debranching enzyme